MVTLCEQARDHPLERNSMIQHHMWKRLAEERHLELTRRAEHVRLIRHALEASRSQRSGVRPGLRERLGDVLIHLGFRLHPAASILKLMEGPIAPRAPSVSTEECV